MQVLRHIMTGAAALMIGTSGAAIAQEKTDFRVAWSIYVGWMPWGYLEESGIMDKWADSTASMSRLSKSTITSNPSTNTPPARLMACPRPIWTRSLSRQEVALTPLR